MLVVNGDTLYELPQRRACWHAYHVLLHDFPHLHVAEALDFREFLKMLVAGDRGLS